MIIQALQSNKLCISVDRFFYPEQSNLIAAYFIFTSNKIKLGLGNFISIVVIPYRNAYTVELYSTLVIFKLLE